MEGYEFNKIAGAVLGTALVVFGLGELRGAIYHSENHSLAQGSKAPLSSTQIGIPAKGSPALNLCEREVMSGSRERLWIIR